jgi:hypothetical protein
MAFESLHFGGDAALINSINVDSKRRGPGLRKRFHGVDTPSLWVAINTGSLKLLRFCTDSNTVNN